MNPHKITEAELMAAIRRMAAAWDVRAFHDAYPLRSWGPGFPDLVLAGPGGVLFRECKGMRGVLEPEQRAWGHLLVSAGADWCVWNPRDWASGTVALELAAISGRNITITWDTIHEFMEGK